MTPSWAPSNPRPLRTNMTNLTPQQLRKAADLKERIDGLQNELNSVLGGEVPVPAQAAMAAPDMPRKGRRRRRKLSPKGRAAISAAAKARWAAMRLGKKSPKGDGRARSAGEGPEEH